MSYNIIMTDSYDWLSNIDSLKFDDKSILIIGSGRMARQYANTLSQLNVNDVSIISRVEDKVKKLCKEFSFKPYWGPYENEISKIKKVDLVIVATPIHTLIPLTKLLLQNHQDNILIEKPGSLYSSELLSLNQVLKDQKVRVAYNRLVYPNFHKLKKIIQQEEITSCNFTFTELVNTIDFKKEKKDAYQRWGISNSLHIISMAFELIGIPKEFSFYQSEKLEWHPTGSIFVGSGYTEKNIPFSYHADWNSAGRWGIEIMTRKNAYRLISLEELYVCPIGFFQWTKVPFKIAFPNVKQGIAEEIAVMLTDGLQNIDLVSLEKAASFNKIAEKIFGYKC